MTSLLTGLRTLIAGSSGATGFAGTFDGRVYLDTAPADVTLPCCVYTASQNRYERTFDGRMHSILVTFEMVDTTANPDTVVLGQTRLRTLLDGTVDSASGYNRVVYLLRQQGSPVFADDIWSVTDVYEIIGLQK